MYVRSLPAPWGTLPGCTTINSLSPCKLHCLRLINPSAFLALVVQFHYVWRTCEMRFFITVLQNETVVSEPLSHLKSEENLADVEMLEMRRSSSWCLGYGLTQWQARQIKGVPRQVNLRKKTTSISVVKAPNKSCERTSPKLLALLRIAN